MSPLIREQFDGAAWRGAFGWVAPPLYRSQPPWLDPFPSDHFANVPLGSGLTYESTSSAKHLAVVGCVSGPKNVDWTDPVYLSTPTDAQYTIRRVGNLPTGYADLTGLQLGGLSGVGATQAEYPGIYVNTRGVAGDPEWATWTGPPNWNNTDRKVHDFQPGGRYLAEIHKFYRTTTSGLILCTNYAYNDVVYDYGLTSGAIASNICAITGLIRSWEVAAALDGDRYAIKHVLKMSATRELLAPGILWPSKSQDADYTSHVGVLPYGQHVSLPMSVDVDAIAGTGTPLADLKAAMLHALQLFGALILIRAGTGSILGFPFESRSPVLTSTQVTGVKAALDAAIPSLRVSSNYHSVGALGANRQPVDPSLIGGPGTRRTVGLGLADFDPVTGYKLPLNPDAGTWTRGWS